MHHVHFHDRVQDLTGSCTRRSIKMQGYICRQKIPTHPPRRYVRSRVLQRSPKLLLSWTACQHHLQRSSVSLILISLFLASRHFFEAKGFKVRFLYCRVALAGGWKEWKSRTQSGKDPTSKYHGAPRNCSWQDGGT